VTAGTWLVRLSAAAEADFQEILLWTEQRFGTAQARVYAKTISDALTALMRGPAMVGVRRREDIGSGFYTLHVARKRRRGRHFILFRVGSENEHRTVDVLRLLYDAMDLPTHVPPEEPDALK
jgi:toxin ParE1/3/4